ncbi:MAG: PaaI family thioesterase [Aliidongia sp.]
MPNENEVTVSYHQVAEGEFAGWSYWPGDHFEVHSGPYFFRRMPDGQMRCAFRAERKHLNGGGSVHGGCLLTFADHCLFVFAQDALAESRGVTVSLNSEFVGPAFEGDLVEATGEVVRAGASLLFVRGMLTANGQPALTFSGVIKKIKRRPGDGKRPG